MNAQLFGAILFGAEIFGLGIDAPVDYDALRGTLTMGPRLDGIVSAEARLSGEFDIGPRLTGQITILPA